MKINKGLRRLYLVVSIVWTALVGFWAAKDYRECPSLGAPEEVQSILDEVATRRYDLVLFVLRDPSGIREDAAWSDLRKKAARYAEKGEIPLKKTYKSSVGGLPIPAMRISESEISAYRSTAESAGGPTARQRELIKTAWANHQKIADLWHYQRHNYTPPRKWYTPWNCDGRYDGPAYNVVEMLMFSLYMSDFYEIDGHPHRRDKPSGLLTEDAVNGLFQIKEAFSRSEFDRGLGWIATAIVPIVLLPILCFPSWLVVKWVRDGFKEQSTT